MAAVVASKVKRQRSSRGPPGGIQLEIGPDGRVRPVAADAAAAPRNKEAEARARRDRKAAAEAAAASAEYYRKVRWKRRKMYSGFSV